MTAPDNPQSDPSEWPVHPAASAFRLMTEEELNQLADSIKTNGLVYPIVRGKWEQNGQSIYGIIDGRNRLRACRIAQIKPDFTELNGSDPRDYIAIVNGDRRNISMGQKALAIALIYPEPGKRGRGNLKSVGLQNFAEGTLSHARTVIEHAPELVKNVKSGVVALYNAYSRTADNAVLPSKPKLMPSSSMPPRSKTGRCLKKQSI